jgi:hypothetical protein
LSALGMLLRLYSYLYELILSLFLLGLAAVAIASHGDHLNLEMLPWKGRALVHWLLGIGIVGLLSVTLALLGKSRFLFLLFTLAVFAMLARGYFLGAYTFSGKEEFRMAIWLTLGAFIAILGALSQFGRKRARSR